MQSPVAVAIDGPAASGKTAVGRRLAELLGFRFLDTGVMYRAVTWAALERGVDLNDAEALTRLTEGLALCVATGEGDERVLVDDTDVTARLRDPTVEQGVSMVARVPGVRGLLVDRQRDLSRDGPMVMAGRDIGTVVLPDAALKLYLTASVRVRAGRRFRDLQRADGAASLDEVVEDLMRRDKIDSERSVSPMRPAGDAVVVQTDERGVEDLAEELSRAVRRL